MLRFHDDDFRWQRPVSRQRRFQWRTVGQEQELAPLPAAALEDYAPKQSLFPDFAYLESTPEAVLKFANQYGTLCRRPEWNPFSMWQQGIRQMRELVKLGDALTGGEEKRIPAALAPFLTRRYLASTAELRPIIKKQKRGEAISASEYVHGALMHLYHAIAPPERFTLEGSWNAQTKQAGVRLKAVDLLDFMYLQLGLALVGGRRFRQCTVCGTWLLLRPGVNRSDRVTCSDYCRLRRCQQRKAQAVELHLADHSAKEIAEIIDADVAKVKCWIASGKRSSTRRKAKS
jgi:hypothetical protein